jgi:SnoaL-like protein
MNTTREILDRHLKCFGEGNLDGILADYAATAVLFMPDGPLKGTDAMRPTFKAIICRVWQAGYRVHHKAAVGRWRACLYSVDRRNGRQCLRNGN